MVGWGGGGVGAGWGDGARVGWRWWGVYIPDVNNADVSPDYSWSGSPCDL